VIAVIGVVLFGIYLVVLTVHAYILNYRAKVDDVVKLSNENSDTLDKLQQWFGEDTLTRCKIADSIIHNTGKKLVDWQFLMHNS
jgi:hypothetical protein